MDAVKFVEERRRMYTLGCIKKGINDYNTKAEAVVAEVEAWAAAHPRKTRQSVFLEQWPNARPADDGVLTFCPKRFDFHIMGVCLKIYSDGNTHPEAWQSRRPEDFCVAERGGVRETFFPEEVLT